MVDFFLLLKLAGAGDELQGIKRGILELADLIAINKADGDNVQAAELARAEFERALAILRTEGGWKPRVVSCSGRTGAGLGAKGAGRRNFELGLVTDDAELLDEVQALYDRIWRGGECGGCKLRDRCEAPLDGL